MSKVSVLLLSICVSAHLATALNLNVRAAASDSCACVGYQDAFENLHADCSVLGDELCTKYIMRMPNEQVCMNNFIGDAETQWCYVSESCAEGKSLQFARAKFPFTATKTAAKWKSCGPDEKSLGQMTLPELNDWCIKNDLDLGLVAQFAYPTWTEGKLPDVWSFWGVPPPEGALAASFEVGTVSAQLKEKLQAQVDSGKPMFFTSPSGHPPFAVSEGNKLYYINFGDKIMAQLVSGADFFEHPGIINEMKCVAGCDEVSVAWWSPLDH